MPFEPPPPPPLLHPHPEDAPFREVTTPVGRLYAICTRPDRVTFTTSRMHATQMQHRLICINGATYTCHLTVEVCTDPERCNHRPENPTERWHPQLHQALRRQPQDRPGTRSAYRQLRHQITQHLIDWLHADEGLSLLVDGEQHWRRNLHEVADQATRRLNQQLTEVDGIATAITHNGHVTPEDERYLRHHTMDLGPTR